jgi:hypothetical protein
MEQTECLEERQGGCAGPVVGRPSYAGTGTPIYRCTHHDEVAYRKFEEARNRYPDSSTPPGWFDPTAAGESWDEEY